MSNVPSEQPNLSPMDEQLVAYLDGELEPEAAKQVEELLASDGTARNRLSQLAASWDLLDQLPRATVDDMFTRTTVQMVAVAAEEELAQVNAAHPAVRRRRWLEGALATVVAAVIGFVIVSVGLPSENKALFRDLSVVHDLELYTGGRKPRLPGSTAKIAIASRRFDRCTHRQHRRQFIRLPFRRVKCQFAPSCSAIDRGTPSVGRCPHSRGKAGVAREFREIQRPAAGPTASASRLRPPIVCRR